MGSENEWEPAKASPDQCEWITVPGTNVNLQILRGFPLTIMPAVAADFNAYIEPLRNDDSASWTPTNAVSTSNHLNATAMDLNWNSHPFRTRGTFSSEQMRTIRELLDFYEDTIFWAGDWNDPIDEMHWQMGYNTYSQPDRLRDFIRRKIRPDGFSTFRRGYETIMTVPLIQQPNGRWTSPSPAWAHLIMRESGGNPTIIQQIIDVNSGGNEAEGLFQITPRTWNAHGGQEFAASPRQATPQQQAIVAARIFMSNPSGSDWGAGLAGRENAAELSAGLVPVPATIPHEEDDMANVPQEEWNDIRDRVRRFTDKALRKVSSKSRYADPNDTWDSIDFDQNDDGFLFDVITEHDAALGDPAALSRVRKKAAEGDIVAQHFLDKLAAAPIDVEPNSNDVPVTDTPVNDLMCWKCGKLYPHELPVCPFCNADPNKPEPTPTPTPTPTPQPTPSPVPGGPVSLPGINSNIVEQFLLLQRFNKELPPDVAEAIDQIVPIIQGLVS